jgi:hypothetical protein
VVNEILKGYGSPLVDPFGIYSPEYLNVIDIVESFGFRYNPALAEIMLSAMIEAGATKEDGKWTYNGSPVVVRMMIRQDDAPRKSMGEIVASELEKVGFTVQKEYGDLNKANTVVYGSNPQDSVVNSGVILGGKVYGLWERTSCAATWPSAYCGRCQLRFSSALRFPWSQFSSAWYTECLLATRASAQTRA